MWVFFNHLPRKNKLIFHFVHVGRRMTVAVNKKILFMLSYSKNIVKHVNAKYLLVLSFIATFLFRVFCSVIFVKPSESFRFLSFPSYPSASIHVFHSYHFLHLTFLVCFLWSSFSRLLFFFFQISHLPVILHFVFL